MSSFPNHREASRPGSLLQERGRLAKAAIKTLSLGVSLALALVPMPSFAGADAPKDGDVAQKAGAYRSMLVLPLKVQGVVPRRVKERYERSSLDALKSEHFETVVVEDCEDAACAIKKAPSAKRPVVLSQVLTAKERNYTLVVELLDGRTGRVLTTSKENCDLCGVGEVSELFVARASVIKDKIESADAFGSTLEVTSTPSGAEIFVDGELMGQTPASLQLSSGQHKVELRKKGHSPSRKTVSIVNGVKEALDFSLPKVLVAPKREPRLDDARRRAISASGWGWLGIGAGSLGLVAGTTLMVLHERPFTFRCDQHPTDPSLSDVDADGDCRYRYDTKGGGIVSLAVGGAMLAAGVTVLVVQAKRNKKQTKSKVAWSSSSRGIGLRF